MRVCAVDVDVAEQVETRIGIRKVSEAEVRGGGCMVDRSPELLGLAALAWLN